MASSEYSQLTQVFIRAWREVLSPLLVQALQRRTVLQVNVRSSGAGVDALDHRSIV